MASVSGICRPPSTTINSVRERKMASQQPASIFPSFGATSQPAPSTTASAATSGFGSAGFKFAPSAAPVNQPTAGFSFGGSVAANSAPRTTAPAFSFQTQQQQQPAFSSFNATATKPASQQQPAPIFSSFATATGAPPATTTSAAPTSGVGGFGTATGGGGFFKFAPSVAPATQPNTGFSFSTNPPATSTAVRTTAPFTFQPQQQQQPAFPAFSAVATAAPPTSALSAASTGGFRLPSAASAPNVALPVTTLPPAFTVNPVTTATASSASGGFSLLPSTFTAAPVAQPVLSGFSTTAATEKATPQHPASVFPSFVPATAAPPATTSAAPATGGFANSGFKLPPSAAPVSQPNAGFSFSSTPFAPSTTTVRATAPFSFQSQPQQQQQQDVPSFNVMSTAAPPTTATLAVTSAGGFALPTVAAVAPNVSLSVTLPSVSTVTSTALVATAAPAGSTLPVPAVSAAPVAQPVVSGSSTISTTALVEPPKPMTYQQLEDHINKWTNDLEEQERTFLVQATEINAWDRVLIENGEKILQLNDSVVDLENEQQRLDHELDFVSEQQNELDQILQKLEQSLISDDAFTYVGGGDVHREQMVELQVNLDSQIRQMGQELSQVVERVNSLNEAGTNEDPMRQIAQVLSKQMDALQWIDEQTNIMQIKANEMKTTLNERRREAKNSRFSNGSSSFM